MLKKLNTATPLWLTILLLCFVFVGLGDAAVTLYTGSFSVASGGTYTDSNQTASRCARYNGSQQLVAASGDCGLLSSFSASSPLAYNSGTGAFTCTGCVNAATSPLSVTSNNVSCSTCITTAGGQTIGGSGLSVTGQISGSGLVTAASSGSSNFASYVPPVYTFGGSSVNSNMHMAWVGTATVTINSCTNGSRCTFSATTGLGVSGISAFSGPVCAASLPTANSGGNAGYFLTANYDAAGPEADIQLLNETGSSISNGTQITITVMCMGS